jgi:hypothetical protein
MVVSNDYTYFTFTSSCTQCYISVSESGSGLDPDSIGSVDPDPGGQKSGSETG